MISFKAGAASSNFNNAFVSKTVDDIKTGKLTLRKVDGDPDLIDDVQLFCNTLRDDIDSNDTELADHETRITNNETTLSDHDTRIIINTRLITSIDTLNTSEEITLNTTATDQTYKVESSFSAGEAQLSITPFGSIEPVDGAVLILIGQSDTDYIKIVYNDADYGCLLNGNAELKRGISLTLTYDKPIKRYIELSRNF